MRIFAEKLPEQLHRPLMPVYLLFGNEPLLLQESKTAITLAAKSQGFDEIYRYQVDASLDWQTIFEHFQALSLFSSRQLVELTLPEGSWNTALTTQLFALSEMIHAETILVVVGQKMTKAQENAKWFKALIAQGCHVNCLTPEINRLPQFVMNRCRILGLTADKEAIQMLAQWHEGNLLALAQSLEKLALLYPDGQLSMIRVETALSRHNHFTIYHWTDALLDGKSNRCQRILRQLQAEGVEPIILLRSVQKELLLLLAIQSQRSHHELYALMEKHRIWKNKRPLYIHALERLTLSKLQALIHQLSEIECLAKLQYSERTWPLLQQFSIDFTQAKQTNPLSPMKHDIL